MATSTSAIKVPPSVPITSAMSIPISKKMQKVDPFYTSPSGSPQSQSPLSRYKSSSAAISPPRESMKIPPRPVSFGQIDTSSPSSSPRTRPAYIDTSCARLSMDNKPVKPAGSSISNPRPQRRLKSILKQQTANTSTAAAVTATDYSSRPVTPTTKSKIHFNTTMEHICHFSKNDLPCEIRDSPRSTIDDSGDVDALTASAGWEAIRQPAVNSWSVLSSNHSAMVKMGISDAIQLESTRVQGDTLIGGIIVRNYSFHKTVRVRYTIDNWINCTDIMADYCNSIKNVGNDPYGLDRFTFTINLPSLFEELEKSEPVTICYALQYSVASRTYWDNNNGANYEITVVNSQSESSSSVSSQDSKQWYETSVPRPRQRSKRGGVKKSASLSTLEAKNLAIEKPFNSLASNFSGNTNSRIEDSFAFAHRFSRGHVKVNVPETSAFNSFDVPFGASPNFGSSFYGTTLADNRSVPILVDKSPKLSKMYDDDFYLSSPPSSFAGA